MATDEMTVILEHFRTWLNSELHSTHSSSSALTPRLCLWSVETNTYQTWSKTSCGAAPGRAEVCASCVEICVCVCGDSLFIVASWLPSTACWHAVLSACVIVCVCLPVLVRLWEGISFTGKTGGCDLQPLTGITTVCRFYESQLKLSSGLHAHSYYSNNTLTWLLSVTQQPQEWETAEKNLEKEQIQAAKVTPELLFRHTRL